MQKHSKKIVGDLHNNIVWSITPFHFVCSINYHLLRIIEIWRTRMLKFIFRNGGIKMSFPECECDMIVLIEFLGNNFYFYCKDVCGKVRFHH